MSETPMVSVRNLVKVYGASDSTAVESVSFDVEAGECISLLGPSGCGKTTTLRCIAGLEEVTAGEIYLDGLLVSDATSFVPPHKRNLGMVFQSYALWPHLTVGDNVAYPLRRQGIGKVKAREVAAQGLEDVGLSGLDHRYPGELSGGQQQRVAVARALAAKPHVLLFDEPLSNLDARLRDRMRGELRELQSRAKFTSIYVTHDQSEAMALSDRIIIMRSGEVAQSGSPLELYRNPRSRFAAEFLGNVNFVPARVLHGESGNLTVSSDLGEVELECPVGVSVLDDEDVMMAVRAQFIDVSPLERGGAAADTEAIATVEDVLFLGDHIEYHVSIGELRVRSVRVRPVDLTIGSQCTVRILYGAATLITSE